MIIVLGKLKLMLSYDIGVLVKDDESHGTAGDELPPPALGRTGRNSRRARIKRSNEFALLE
jgi:hypothetical protein